MNRREELHEAIDSALVWCSSMFLKAGKDQKEVEVGSGIYMRVDRLETILHMLTKAKKARGIGLEVMSHLICWMIPGTLYTLEDPVFLEYRAIVMNK